MIVKNLTSGRNHGNDNTGRGRGTLYQNSHQNANHETDDGIV